MPPNHNFNNGSRYWVAAFYLNTLTIQVIVYVLRPTAIYRALELNVPAVWLGALGASFAVVPLLLAVPSGQVIDRLGERLVMICGAVLTVVACVVFWSLASNVWWLITGCVCLGTGHLGCVVSQQSLVANHTQLGRYDTAFGRYTFVAAAGQTVGPGLILLFSNGRAIPDTAALFGWAAVASIILLVTALLIPRGQREAMDAVPPKEAMGRLVRLPGLPRAVTVSSIVTAALDVITIYLPVLGAERDISAGVIGILLAARSAASMISRFFLGQLSARLGSSRVLVGSIALAIGGMALVAIPGPLWLLAIAVVALGPGLSCAQPLTMSWLAEAAPPGLRGSAMSLRLMGNRAGQVFIPSIAGTLAAATGVTGVLWLTAFSLAAVGMIARSLRYTPSPTHRDQTVVERDVKTHHQGDGDDYH